MTVILVVHILVSIVLVGVVLLQRSEGGALGVGGGGGGGGLMSGRGAAGALLVYDISRYAGSCSAARKVPVIRGCRANAAVRYSLGLPGQMQGLLAENPQPLGI